MAVQVPKEIALASLSDGVLRQIGDWLEAQRRMGDPNWRRWGRSRLLKYLAKKLDSRQVGLLATPSFDGTDYPKLTEALGYLPKAAIIERVNPSRAELEDAVARLSKRKRVEIDVSDYYKADLVEYLKRKCTKAEFSELFCYGRAESIPRPKRSKPVGGSSKRSRHGAASGKEISDQSEQSQSPRALDPSRREEHRVTDRSRKLGQLLQRFHQLVDERNRQRAGIQLQTILNDLFSLEGMKPRRPFRINGEEIDGSFVLDRQVYLLEAKWVSKPLSEGPLLVFFGRISGKSAHTRGVLIAINGFSEPAKDAIVRGRQPHFFCMDGGDLAMVLEGHIDLKEFLRQRQRLLAEEGAMFVAFRDLRKGSRTEA